MSTSKPVRSKNKSITDTNIVALPPRVAEASPGSIAAVRAEREQRRLLAFLFPLTLIVMDAGLIATAFWMAYRLRLMSEYVGPLRFADYYGMLAIQVPAMIVTYFFYRLYNRRRVMSLIDEFGRVLAGTSVGTVVTLAATSILFKNTSDFD